jgi:predicted nucleic acid-binding protein
MAMRAADSVFIDTNILILASIKHAPLHQQARLKLDELQNSGRDLWISPQVIREYMSNMTRDQTYNQAIPMVDVLQQIAIFRAAFRLGEETQAVLEELLNLAAQFPLRGKQVHDVNIVATMIVYGIPSLFTRNTDDFKQFSAQIQLISLN